jgi:hypothetical protein
MFVCVYVCMYMCACDVCVCVFVSRAQGRVNKGSEEKQLGIYTSS